MGNLIKDTILTLGDDGLWRDDQGTIRAIADKGYSSPDADNRAGYGIFSMPASHPCNGPAKIHDFEYSSPAYQKFHTRREADEELFQRLKQLPTERRSLLPYIFYGIVRLFGGRFWDNKKTDV